MMEFNLLGPFEVRRSGNLVKVGGPRQRAVLAALLSRPNSIASMPYLLEAVWEKPPAAPESNIRTYVCGLRRRLSACGDTRIAVRDCGYVMLTEAGEVDVQVFLALTDSADAALRAGDAIGAADRFCRALGLWRGRPLEGLDVGPRLQAEMTLLEDRRVLAAERYAQAASQLHRYDDVVSVLRGLTTDYPLCEALWSELMSALSVSGRRAEALAAYRKARAHLAGELGLEPGPRLQRLHQQALAADAGLGG
jgi:DNA-binding SARP family transcriptional activator